MKVLVVGSGGREHAIVSKLRENECIKKIYCSPGNGGISQIAECVDIKATDINKLLDFAVVNGIDFTVVGMEDPLVLGIVDIFKEKGLKIFGPTKMAARIEGSKAFSKGLMKKYNIPTAQYETFDNYDKAINYIQESKLPIVIKADGLAFGKGVLICETLLEAENALKDIFIEKVFGNAGNQVVIEEFLTGIEVSVLAFCDGKSVIPMVSAKDHKRALDNDMGLNTGGMGTISPNPVYTDEVAAYCMEHIYKPTMIAMEKEGCPFAGVLFFGLMVTNNGVYVIEYNCRFGDPETQVVLPRLKTDLLTILKHCENGTLDEIDIQWDKKAAACVMLASGGYPEDYEKGYAISGIDTVNSSKDVTVYHSATVLKDDIFYTNGGRVIGVSAKGETLNEAICKAYEFVDKISFKNMHYRKDIGTQHDI